MKLGVMLRVRARAASLRVVLDELLAYRTLGIDPKIHVLADRPTTDVQAVLDDYRDHFWGLHYLDFPILSRKDGERFREAKYRQYHLLEPASPDWVLLQDDDRIFERAGALRELPTALADPDVDLLYAKSLFLWDDHDHVNLSRDHCSPVLFRYRPDQSFPLDRDIQAPLPLHDEAIVRGRIRTLDTPLLDVGTLRLPERERVYRAFLEAGKADAYVASIITPPRIALLSSVIRRPYINPFEEAEVAANG